jgi:hypothetical protein
MNGKFKIANGLNAMLRWINDIPDVAESCRKACINGTLMQDYAVITIDVDDEQVHFVQWIEKTDRVTAKRIMQIWSSDPNAAPRVHWVVYCNEAYFLGSVVGSLLLDSVKRKIAPGVITLLQMEKWRRQ